NPPPPSWPPPPAPAIQGEVRTEYRQPTPIVDTSARGQPMPTPASPTRDLAKARAVQLVMEARRLQREGHLVESRQQAIEAQKLGAVYAPTEDRPDMVLVELAALCKKRVESLIQ